LTGEAWETKTSCTRRGSRRALSGKRDIVAVCACCAIARIFYTSLRRDVRVTSW